MISPISDTLVPSVSAQTAGVSVTRVSTTTASSASATTSAASSTSIADSVDISGYAQALSLYDQGLSIEQIAFRLGLDVDAVRHMLGVSSAPSTQRLYSSRGIMI